MGTTRLVTVESSGLTYDQAGFDFYEKDERDVGSKDHAILFPGEGTNVDNAFFMGNPDDNAHWIGIHNCGTVPSSEVISIMATSSVGDDFAKDGDAADYNADTNYLELAGGDVIYGKFIKVGILKTASSLYKDRVRLIRGV
jgi:hypothetical protein